MPAYLLTGGSSGLGLSLVRAVLTKGHIVVLTTRSISNAQKAAPDIEHNGGHWLQIDFADSKLEQVVKDAVTKYVIDVVVNNAGYAAIGAVEDCSTDSIRTQYEANLFGPVRIIQAATPVLRQRGRGTIANVGSSISFAPFPGASIYASTKAALRTLTEALVAELAPFNIRVLLFEPGRFRTNSGGNAQFAGPGEGFSEAYKGTMVEKVVKMLSRRPVAPGNPDAAALRMIEVVTKTGMGAVQGWRFPFGTDAYEGAGKAGKQWVEVAEKAKEIACSTDFAK